MRAICIILSTLPAFCFSQTVRPLVYTNSYQQISNKNFDATNTFPALNYQAPLVSGTNIKSINGIALLGSGNINISGGAVTWGDITGTLASQTDLQSALNAKQPAGAYLTSITSGNVTTALGFTPYNATNPDGYISGVPAQTFASLTGKPTTITGYGITDAFTQATADGLYSLLGHTHTWASLTSKPATFTAAGLTGTTAEVAPSTNRNYVTDAQATQIGSSSGKFISSTLIATNTNLTAAAGVAYYLPASTLTANRTVNVTALSANGDYVEIYNNETGFTWSFTGAAVYLSDETTVTTLLANTNYALRFVNGKIRIIN